ncbi:MAG: carbohydrate kinase [Ruminococcus sp.]|nr:carbohydrate kinase [Ruminococcus sp.]MCM1478529.1 carbohydrate kinase [Muribaculaceae bacterium]
MSDIISIGEMLVDFTAVDAENGDIYYKQNPGGAPANVAVMAAKAGAASGFIGKLGKDMFGLFLRDTLEKEGVDTRGVILDPNFSTTLAFVRKTEEDRSFVFYRKNSADVNLNFNEVKTKLVDECKILHFGSLMLTGEPSRSATVNTVEYAKQQGKIITYDPNWREALWNSKDEAVKEMRSVLRYVDIIKVSETELQVLTECANLLPAIAKLLNSGIRVVCITQGAKGCIIATKHGIERFPAFKTNTVDTLGAGDSFFGAFIARLALSGKSIDEIVMDDLREFAVYANACGALSAAKVGAIPAMPTHEEIVALIKASPEEEGYRI